MRDSSSTNGLICFGPRAQFKPTLRRFACETEVQKASTVCPVIVRPDMSTIVPEPSTGRRTPCSAKYRSMAKSAAFMFRVSKAVSTRSMSTPPSTRPRVWS